MNAILLLMGLLVLSYLGGFLVGGRTIRGAGLPSGIEYVVIGFALGPHALGLLSTEVLDSFEALAEVGVGWLAFVIGLDFGRTRTGRVKAGHLLLGIASGLFTGAAVAAAVWFFSVRVRHVPPTMDLVILAGGVGAACAETTRHVVRWAIERHGAHGPLTTLLNGKTHADDFVPLTATAVLFSLAPKHEVPVHVPVLGWVGITVGLGLVLGAMTALHIGRELRVDQTWGVLLGTSVLGIGVAARLGLAGITVLFYMGVATAGLSRHRQALRAMVTPVERPILLPALLLAGANIDFRAMPGLGWIAAVAIAARILAKLVIGLPIGVRRASPFFGLGLLSSGALSMTVGLAFALRFPGPIGGTVLAAAAVASVVGEIIGPSALRRFLRDAGEIDEEAAASSSSTAATQVTT